MTFALDKVGKTMRYQIVTGPISYRTLSWMRIDRIMITIPQLMDWINWYPKTRHTWLHLLLSEYCTALL